MRRSCGSRGCSRPSGYGKTGRFCREHAELLGRVRDELKTMDRYRIYGTKPGFLADESEEEVAA